MRWWTCAAACALLACARAAAAAAEASGLPLVEDAFAPAPAPATRTIVVSAVSASGASGALGALVALALNERGVRARSVPAPRECDTPTARNCTDATLRSLVRGEVQAALLAVPAARPLHVLRLRDAGLEELGDAAPPQRLACLVSHARPAPRSLLDFTDQAVAARYRLPREDIAAALRNDSDTSIVPCWGSNCTTFEFEPPWCSSECSTLLTGDQNEAAILNTIVQEHRLRTRVRALGARASAVAGGLARASRAVLVCDRAPELGPGFQPLGPPPCTSPDDCPFESYRLVKVVNARELAYSPSALRVLGKLSLSERELGQLMRARGDAALTEARRVLARHGEWAGPAGEARMAVLLPASSRRDAFDADALRAAAALAEEDAGAPGAVGFKVEVVDDGCAATLAFKYLTDALGAEYGALSGVAGPACAAAFGDVVRQSAALALPVLAYSAQAPPGARAPALLAAGDARQLAPAWAALLAHMGWRRVAVLSEMGSRAALRPSDLGADVVVHVELPGDGDDLDAGLVTQWAERARAANARILLVSAEDARVVRAAACAAQRAGLPAAAWLLPALPPRWARPRPSDAHGCTHDEVQTVTDGHLTLLPSWQADWDDRPTDARSNWTARWRARCRRAAGGPCAAPGPHAALLYDMLRLWAAALRRVLAARPAALDDLHRPDVVSSLMEQATGGRYAGLTGEFEWERAGTALARAGPLVLLQTLGGVHQRVGRVEHGRLALATALRWPAAGGAAPDDGGERCTLQALANALHVDCRAAFALLGAAALALPVAALAVAAWHCKRRAEREYRERLRLALDLRALSPKPGDLDRWEIPRERVVINRKLGTGAFGTVYGGHALLAEDRGWTAVAVKTLKPGATTDEKLDFLSEAEAMKCFDHKNVVRLLGVVTKTEPVCTVMEFMLYGDLKNYLLARRHLVGTSGDAGEEVSAARLTSMALGAARALSYLAQRRYVHRDVAARNCLVSAHRTLKLADFGMTRLVFENDYYRFSRKGMLPVRWMAPESLALGVFSPASDVWSFGVLLYEIVTFGSLPFQGLSNAEVLARVKEGHTLTLPPGLKPQLEGLIKSCWQQQPKARPGAAEVAAFLADWPRLLAPCPDVPLDALPLGAAWRTRDRAEARWVSWAAPPSADTDTTYLSADGAPRESDAFLPDADALLPETDAFARETDDFIPEEETFLP